MAFLDCSGNFVVVSASGESILFNCKDKKLIHLTMTSSTSTDSAVSSKSNFVGTADDGEQQNATANQKSDADIQPQSLACCSRIVNGNLLVATAVNRRNIYVWQVRLDDIEVEDICRYDLPKQATVVRFDCDGWLLVADRFGNVIRFPAFAKREENAKKSIESAETSETSEQEDGNVVEKQNGSILLGHLSMVLDVLLTSQFLISCDRDEKIRISHYPDCYDIHSFCLGHSAFVRSVCCIRISADHERLISLSGDGTVRVWTLDGRNVAIFDLKQPVDNETDDSVNSSFNVSKMAVVSDAENRRFRIFVSFLDRPYIETGVLAFSDSFECSWRDGNERIYLTDESDNDFYVGVWDVAVSLDRLLLVLPRLCENGSAECQNGLLIWSVDEKLNLSRISTDESPFGAVSNVVLPWLKTARHDLPRLTKQVVYDNVKNYLEFKQKRMTQKRKHSPSNGND